MRFKDHLIHVRSVISESIVLITSFLKDTLRSVFAILESEVSGTMVCLSDVCRKYPINEWDIVGIWKKKEQLSVAGWFLRRDADLLQGLAAATAQKTKPLMFLCFCCRKLTRRASKTHLTVVAVKQSITILCATFGIFLVSQDYRGTQYIHKYITEYVKDTIVMLL